MKIIAFTVALILVTPARAETVSPILAKKHVGETVTVHGIASVYKAKSGVTFIEIGGRGRNAPFAAFIDRAHASRFPNVIDYDGKMLEVSGQVDLYKGRPEIILTDTSQVSVR